MKVNELVFAVFSICAIAIYVHKYEVNYTNYCVSEERIVDDTEMIQSAVKIRLSEIAHYGGIDKYEKYFISLNRDPEEAGRDFNAEDPDCCSVYRGKRDTKKNCGIETRAVCVRLRFPKLEKEIEDNPYYKREGRTYIFSTCGKLQENY